MRKALSTVVSLALLTLCGVASADRHDREVVERKTVVEHRTVERGHGPVVEHRTVVERRPVIEHRTTVVERRPVIEHRTTVIERPGVVVHDRVVVNHYRPISVYRHPHMLPPAIRVENYRPLAGYAWVRGYYAWVGDDYQWVGGHYERERVGYRFRDGYWETVGGVPAWHAGVWVNL